ncbi:MAG: hypothetical protein WBD48_01660 [Pseudolabrys sp.]|jgi:hypothetical protein
MLRLVSYFVVALIGALLAGYWTDSESTSAQAATFAHRWIAIPEQGKQDRLVVPERVALTRPRDQVQTIEATDNHQGAATIVYRDRNGAVVFRNDPAAQSTVAVKGIAFPALPSDATVRQMTPRPAAPQTKDKSQQTPAVAPKLMDGCEPSLSPLASREASTISGRCIASRSVATRLALAQ